MTLWSMKIHTQLCRVDREGAKWVYSIRWEANLAQMSWAKTDSETNANIRICDELLPTNKVSVERVVSCPVSFTETRGFSPPTCGEHASTVSWIRNEFSSTAFSRLKRASGVATCWNAGCQAHKPTIPLVQNIVSTKLSTSRVEDQAWQRPGTPCATPLQESKWSRRVIVSVTKSYQMARKHLPKWLGKKPCREH
jgi:hypothetical protein